MREPDSLDYERLAAALQPFTQEYLSNVQLDEVGIHAARIGRREREHKEWLARHQVKVSEALSRGECPDCGRPLTERGAPGICAAGHTPEGS